MRFLTLFSAAAFSLAVFMANAATYLATPVTYGSVMSQAVSGDDVILEPGSYGALRVSGKSGVDVIGFDRDAVIASSIRVDYSSSDVTVKNITVVGGPHGQDSWAPLVHALPDTSNVTFSCLMVTGGPDFDYLTWTNAQWRAIKFRGIFLQGTNAKLEHSMVAGVRVGASLVGASSSVVGNVFRGVQTDFVTVEGGNNLIQGNLMFDGIFAYDVPFDSSIHPHADCMQTREDTYGIQVIENICVAKFLDGSPHGSVLQGAMFHGDSVPGVVFRGNQFIIQAYWGINLREPDGGLVEDNVVVAVGAGKAGFYKSRIRDYYRKGVVAAAPMVVRNNAAEQYSHSGQTTDSGGNAVIVDGAAMADQIMANLHAALGKWELNQRGPICAPAAN